MNVKLILLFAIIIISASSNQLFAEDIKINKKISGKSYKILELTNHFLKTEYKKISVIIFKIESTRDDKGFMEIKQSFEKCISK